MQIALLAVSLSMASLISAPAQEAGKGRAIMEPIADAKWAFGGELGRRVDANESNWLLRAPDTNPGLIQMFHRRDRRLPYKTPVPWAGEFAGKYLISAVQACRMTENPELRGFVASFVDELAACQAEDGYLGPWRKDERLLGHWDLWGHYHCMLGLLMWHDMTGDEAALTCARRAADCICDIYADGGRRPIEAGTPQINLAVLHIMGMLERRTGDARYLKLIQRIEEDMQTDGDWLRLGAKGTPYYQLPGGGTRWESLHIVQGLAERYLTTGEQEYKDAVVNLWKSIREFDRHPSGAFSTHESAYGTVYESGSIETCCSVAWEALTIDVLRLTGDPTVADELELTTWNQVLGAQHPSGSWWSYDTPIDGVRVPSFHHINFQYRPGTPELNCCSVNAPRGLGMLSEWAVMEQKDGLAVNFYGSCELNLKPTNLPPVVIKQETDYPIDGHVIITVSPETSARFTLALRIPAWSKQTLYEVNQEGKKTVPEAGSYLNINREWAPGDRISLTFDMSPRSWVGKRERFGKAAIYAGPVLLAFDAFYNAGETTDIPAIDLKSLELTPVPVEQDARLCRFAPLGLWKCRADDGAELTLCDFASAGAHGTDYVAWLPAAHIPPEVSLDLPKEGEKGKPGPILFSWNGFGPADMRYELKIAKDPAFSDVVLTQAGIAGDHVTIREGLGAPGMYYWTVTASCADGMSDSTEGPRIFSVAAGAARAFLSIGEDGLMVAASLDGKGTPTAGVCGLEEGLTPASGHTGAANTAVAFDGKTSGLRYDLPFFPETEYSFAGWVCPEGLPTKGLQQVFSAWRRGGDDPLRVTFEGKALHARIEAKQGFIGTKGVELKNGEWVHVAAVKTADTLTLYINGEAAQSIPAHARIRSGSKAVGIGFNPLHTSREGFKGRIDDIVFFARALSPDEVKQRYETGAK